MGERGPTRDAVGVRVPLSQVGLKHGGALLTLPPLRFADATIPELLEDGQERVPAPKSQVKFNLRSWPDAEEDGCPLALGHRKCLEDCKFNVTAKTFFIIHGWTVSAEEPARRRCLAFSLST